MNAAKWTFLGTAIMAAAAIFAAWSTARSTKASAVVSADLADREAQRKDQASYVDRLAADVLRQDERLVKYQARMEASEEASYQQKLQLRDMTERVRELENRILRIAALVPPELALAHPELFRNAV